MRAIVNDATKESIDGILYVGFWETTVLVTCYHAGFVAQGRQVRQCLTSPAHCFCGVEQGCLEGNSVKNFMHGPASQARNRYLEQVGLSLLPIGDNGGVD